VFNATFNNISVYVMVVSFIGGRNLEKTTKLSQVTDKLYHILYFWIYLPCANPLTRSQGTSKNRLKEFA
jgi:hypothetical protein